MDPADAELLRQASSGDAASLDTLLRRYLPGLIAFVRVRARPSLRAKDSTLDLVQSACREVLADLPRREWPDEGTFRHWLYVAAERKILDRARYHARERREAAREARAPSDASEEWAWARAGLTGLASPSREAEAREEVERLEAALARLSEDYREVIVLSRIVGLSHQQIAEHSGRSEGAARVLLHRALARLAREMGASEDAASLGA